MEIRYTYTGVINPDLVAGAITWLSNQLWEGRASKLKFILSSTGGDGDSAVRLYDYLRALPFEVETIGFGQIDSAANIIFLAGKKRFAIKGCRFLLHEGSFRVGNPVSALHVHEETLELFKEIHRRQVEIISRETGKKTGEIKKILREGQVLNAEEAKKFGIVHEIIEKLPPNPNQPQPQTQAGTP